jgi:hypothetical protein
MLSGLVAAAALLGCARSAFPGTGTTGTVTPANARPVAGKSVAARIAESYLERLSAARPQAGGGGSVASGAAGPPALRRRPACR